MLACCLGVVAACSICQAVCALGLVQVRSLAGPVGSSPIVKMPPRKAKEAAGSPPKKTKAPKAKKDPNAPKKPSGAYIFFCNDKRGEVKQGNPEYGVAQIGKELGARWKEVTDKDKEVRLSEKMVPAVGVQRDSCLFLLNQS